MAIIFFDIDGTLAEGRTVPESAAAAVARTRTAGNLVFICTGRPRGYAESAFGAYADGFVCCNGRLAVRGDEHVIERPIAPEQVETICGILDALDAGYAFFGEDALYYGGNPRYRQLATDVHGGVLACFDLEKARETNAHLFSFDVYFADVSDRAAITEALGDLCLVNPHGPHPSADVTVLGYGKGDAVRDVAAALGIAHKDTYAFGDGINDLSMIETVAHGVAMGNGVDEIKAAAEYVTSDIHDDGVARGLAHYGLA